MTKQTSNTCFRSINENGLTPHSKSAPETFLILSLISTYVVLDKLARLFLGEIFEPHWTVSLWEIFELNWFVSLLALYLSKCTSLPVFLAVTSWK